MPRYEPKSDALKAFAASEAATSDDPPSEEHLRLLLAMIQDEDRSNRDWAAFLLSICVLDTPEIRAALLRAVADEDQYVRGEAIVGLTERDPGLALPLIQKALSMDRASLQIFEAAGLLAHPSLVEDLRCFLGPSDDSHVERWRLTRSRRVRRVFAPIRRRPSFARISRRYLPRCIISI